jgi:hypothetical protein
MSRFAWSTVTPSRRRATARWLCDVGLGFLPPRSVGTQNSTSGGKWNPAGSTPITGTDSNEQL